MEKTKKEVVNMAKLVKWEPFRELDEIRSGFDRLLDKFRTDFMVTMYGLQRLTSLIPETIW